MVDYKVREGDYKPAEEPKEPSAEEIKRNREAANRYGPRLGVSLKDDALSRSYSEIYAEAKKRQEAEEAERKEREQREQRKYVSSFNPRRAGWM